MITTADALEIMAVIAACHQRTAPRMDDPEVAAATAGVWADLLAEFDFDVRELVEAVKHRAKVCSDAPEIADVIRVARQSRTERMARTAAPVADADSWDGVYPGDVKAAPDVADYPVEWDSGQRVSAYWYALRLRAMPQTTAGWRAIADQLEEHRQSREGIS